MRLDNIITKCEVCGGTPPPGHRFCDNCWPQAALDTGKAGCCNNCGAIKIIEKMQKVPDGTLLCPACAALKFKV